MARPPLLSSPSAVIVCILCYLSAIRSSLAATPAFSPAPPDRIPRRRGGGGRRRPSNALLGMGATASRGGGGDGADPPPRPSESARRAYRGKTILITGASRGLGRSLAIALASSCDPSLLILSGRDERALAGVRGECERAMIASSAGGGLRGAIDASNDGVEDDGGGGGGGARRVEIVVCDLADGASVEKLAEESLRLAASRRRAGRSPGESDGAVVDVLINNGGVSSRSSFLETRIDVDEMLMRVNFHSGAALAKGLVPAMIGSGNGGRVIWISSVQGKLGTPYRTSYAASKFAVQGYCESLRSELASGGVSVHVVSPGYVRTDLSLSAVMGDGRSYRKMDETTANGADPGEVAVSILDSVAAGKSDIVVAATFSARVAMWLKFLAPSILDRILAKRFEKQRVTLKKIE